jgi:hypothetical protein
MSEVLALQKQRDDAKLLIEHAETAFDYLIILTLKNLF